MKKNITLVFVSLVLLVVIASACQKQVYQSANSNGNGNADVSTPLGQGLDNYDQMNQAVDDTSLSIADEDLKAIDDL